MKSLIINPYFAHIRYSVNSKLINRQPNLNQLHQLYLLSNFTIPDWILCGRSNLAAFLSTFLLSAKTILLDTLFSSSFSRHHISSFCSRTSTPRNSRPRPGRVSLVWLMSVSLTDLSPFAFLYFVKCFGASFHGRLSLFIILLLYLLSLVSPGLCKACLFQYAMSNIARTSSQVYAP